MINKKANLWVVARNICAAVFDMAGDWTYFCALYFGGNAGCHHAQYNLLIHVAFNFCVIGSILSLWVITTSLGRTRRLKSLCCKCTVPRLATSLILMHHVPQFILTTYIDLTLSGDITWAGWLNICSSMVALMNTFAIEGLIGSNEKAAEDLEIGTLAATGCDEPVGSDYEAMS